MDLTDDNLIDYISEFLNQTEENYDETGYDYPFNYPFVDRNASTKIVKNYDTTLPFSDKPHLPHVISCHYQQSARPVSIIEAKMKTNCPSFLVCKKLLAGQINEGEGLCLEIILHNDSKRKIFVDVFLVMEACANENTLENYINLWENKNINEEVFQYLYPTMPNIINYKEEEDLHHPLKFIRDGNIQKAILLMKKLAVPNKFTSSKAKKFYLKNKNPVYIANTKYFFRFIFYHREDECNTPDMICDSNMHKNYIYHCDSNSFKIISNQAMLKKKKMDHELPNSFMCNNYTSSQPPQLSTQYELNISYIDDQIKNYFKNLYKPYGFEIEIINRNTQCFNQTIKIYHSSENMIRFFIKGIGLIDENENRNFVVKVGNKKINNYIFRNKYEYEMRMHSFEIREYTYNNPAKVFFKYIKNENKKQQKKWIKYKNLNVFIENPNILTSICLM